MPLKRRATPFTAAPFTAAPAIATAFAPAAPTEARRAVQDGCIWPVERPAMVDPRWIVTRMAEDIAATRLDLACVERFHLRRFGWRAVQSQEYFAGSLGARRRTPTMRRLLYDLSELALLAAFLAGLASAALIAEPSTPQAAAPAAARRPPPEPSSPAPAASPRLAWSAR